MKRVREESATPGGEPLPVILLRAWWEAAGPAMARCARPIGVADGTLQIVVGDPTWQRQIRELSQILLRRLRRWPGLHEVRDISVILESGSAPVPVPRAPVATRASTDPEPPEEILRAAHSIGDPDLSRRWCAAVGRLLARASASAGPER